MDGLGNDEQVLVVALEALEGVFAEIARVGFLAVDEEHGTFNLAGIGKYGGVEESEARCDVPALARIDGTRVESARRLEEITSTFFFIIVWVLILYTGTKLLRKKHTVHTPILGIITNSH